MRHRPSWLHVAVGCAAGALVLFAAVSGASQARSVNADTPTTTTTTTVTPPPTVAIAASPTTGQTGQPTTFTATVSNAPMGAALTYSWTFGDGGSGAGMSPMHTYANVSPMGGYTVQVLVFGAGATPLSATLQYQVIASLGISAGGPYTGQIGQPVMFKATAATGGTVPGDTVYTWNFGDGSATVTGATVSHIYNTTGTFNVTLTAMSASGANSGSATTTATISNTPAPTPFTLTISGPSQATAGQQVSYQAVVASGTAPSDVVYTWTWGDNTANSTGQSVSHTYAAAGNYTITVNAVSTSTPASNATASAAISVQAGSTTPPANGGNSVTYQTGWNIVAGPSGQTFTQADGVLYTFQAGDTAYESQPNGSGITAGRGYWAYFASPTTVTIIAGGTSQGSVYAPPSQYVMIGNPSTTQTLTIHGADQAVVYDSTSGQYVPVTTLGPGKGAWVISLNGGTVTVGP